MSNEILIMMYYIKLFKNIRRYKMLNMLIRWILLALGLLFTAWIVPGISFVSVGSALWAAFVMGIVNVFIRPLLLILTFPLNLLTLGLFTFIINALMFLLVAKIVPGFMVLGFWSAFFGALILSILSVIVNMIDAEL